MNRAPRVHVLMTGRGLTRWLLLDLAMVLVDAAVIVAVVATV